ncbi:Zinc finger protein [Pseudolycoriella hygida]|uniref:Zinc finger protein n=1 Tax=Pseudolycoriella hygida TaxID=35572 RepID=A0A9Q0RY73_9DIPT|nr:Zinc finger protein [Pseudolycoriella hygida]
MYFNGYINETRLITELTELENDGRQISEDFLMPSPPDQTGNEFNDHLSEYPHPNFLNSQAQLQQDYKPVPFNTFPPYSTDPKSVNSSVSLINVTSSSPTHNSGIQSSISSPSNQLIPTNQATPSPSSNQLDKCGHISETPNQLGEHYATSHGSSLQNEASRNAGVNEDNEMSSFPYNPYIKEEQPCDILDLDSQKIVYSPNDDHSQQGPLPPMHSLHHLQIPLIWQEHHALPYTQDIKPTLYPTIQPKQDFVPTMKQDYIHHQSQIGHQTPDVKQFASDVTGNQVTSSPSEFPSTTTPQENGGQTNTNTMALYQGIQGQEELGPKYHTIIGNGIETHNVTDNLMQGMEKTTEHRCTSCDKVFNKSCYLTQHNKTFHSGEKPYKCQKCGKRFACGPSHELHLSKHSAVKRFQCSRCVKSFNYKTDLRRHMCLHDGIKPFTCPTCGKGFIRKDHMMKHTETHTRKSANLAKKQEHFQPYLQSIDLYDNPGSNDVVDGIVDFLTEYDFNSQAQSQQDYKPVPFNTYPPYSTDPSSVNSCVSLINVTSSGPTHNSGIQSSISSPSNQLNPTNQATPSPSSNQLDKCGHISETPNQLGEHYATSHGSSLQNEASRNAGANEDNEISSFPYNPYIQEEQPCDFLDLYTGYKTDFVSNDTT